MNAIIADDSIVIRKMEDSDKDFELYLKWMTDPETMKYWEGMTVRYDYDRVVKEYRESAKEGVTLCIIEYDGAPIGFCQYCILDAQSYDVPQEQYSKYVKEAESAYGIDIFLGEVSFRDRGIGTRCMKLLIRFLFGEFHADVILIDPKVHNARAIQCYHKCGFEDYFVEPHRELQDGIYHDSLIMGIRLPYSSID